MKKKIVLSIIILIIILVIILIVLGLIRANRIIFCYEVGAFSDNSYTRKEIRIYNNGTIVIYNEKKNNTTDKKIKKKLTKEDLNKVKAYIKNIENEKLEKIQQVNSRWSVSLVVNVRINLNKDISIANYSSEGINKILELTQKYFKEDN